MSHSKYLNFRPFAKVGETVKIPKKSDLAIYGNLEKRKQLLKTIRLEQLSKVDEYGIDLGNGYLIP